MAATPMATLRLHPNSSFFSHKLCQNFHRNSFNLTSLFSTSSSPVRRRNVLGTSKLVASNKLAVTVRGQVSYATSAGAFSGLEDAMAGYILGKKKATEVAHSVWKHVVQKGDAVVDATCGNGHDTLVMLNMVADGHRGRVYAMDIQEVALESTLFLLDQSVNHDQKELVQLSAKCHSKMEEVVPKGISVRLVAFNLGYLPGGDKTLITRSETTLLALEAAERIVAPGGLISIVVYVGHPGGSEELGAVQKFASGLPMENWSCCKLQMLNRALAPIPIFLFRR